jgi:hypothetical protein
MPDRHSRNAGCDLFVRAYLAQAVFGVVVLDMAGGFDYFSFAN